jgi:hypothetical protein
MGLDWQQQIAQTANLFAARSPEKSLALGRKNFDLF